jgi:hypothetical protein
MIRHHSGSKINTVIQEETAIIPQEMLDRVKESTTTIFKIT